MRVRMDGVYRLSVAILGDEADARDAAQNTFITAWRQIRAVRDPDKFDAWLQRVAVNAARMTHRSRRRRGVREIPQSWLGPARNEGPALNPAEADGHLLDGALRTLDIDQRSLLVLHHLEGRSIAELAAILDIPAGTVKSRLHTARRALQAAIEAEVSDR